MSDLHNIKVEIDIDEDERFQSPRRSRRNRKCPETYQSVGAGPSQSSSNKKKEKKKINDHRGVHIATGMDVCDCLEEGCPGCHFPCPKCRSPKCGADCRRNRTVSFDCVVIDGTGRTLINKYKD